MLDGRWSLALLLGIGLIFLFGPPFSHPIVAVAAMNAAASSPAEVVFFSILAASSFGDKGDMAGKDRHF